MTESETVALVVHAGLGTGYDVLESGDELQTSGGIDHYAHVSVISRDDVDEKLDELAERGLYDGGGER